MRTLLVVLVDDDTLTARHELLLDLVAEVVVDVAEGEHVRVDRVVLQPLHRLVELVVLRLQVLELELLPQDHLVEGAREVGVDQLALHQRLADEPADELEVVQVVRVYVGLGVRLVGAARGGFFEERVVLVKDFPGDHQEPLALQTTCVVTWLVDEGHLDPSLQLAQGTTHELVVGALEEVVPVDLDVHAMAGQLADARMVAEDELLGLKIQQVGLLEQDGDGLLFELPAGLVEVLDDFEVDGLVLHQYRLHLLQGLRRVDAEDLVEEIVVSIVEELQGLLVHFSEVRNV